MCSQLYTLQIFFGEKSIKGSRVIIPQNDMYIPKFTYIWLVLVLAKLLEDSEIFAICLKCV